MASEQPHRRQRAEGATGPAASSSALAARVGAVVGLFGGAVQLVKPMVAFGGVSLAVGLFLLVEAGLGLATVAGVLVWRRDLRRAGGLLIATGLLAVVMDVGGGGAPPRVIPAVVILAGGVLARFAAGRDPARQAAQPGGGSPGVAGSPAAAAVGWLGVAAQVAVIVPFLAIGLVAPAWAVVVLYALWAALLALALRLRRAHPLATLLVPPATFALMVGLLMAGGSVFDWQA
ncbi:MAG: hypothetical protein M3N52_04640 [Actinomycetota bacterium]|nr:hypothetical protein [Actinomycetota bacterium]